MVLIFTLPKKCIFKYNTTNNFAIITELIKLWNTCTYYKFILPNTNIVDYFYLCIIWFTIYNYHTEPVKNMHAKLLGMAIDNRIANRLIAFVPTDQPVTRIKARRLLACFNFFFNNCYKWQRAIWVFCLCLNLNIILKLYYMIIIQRENWNNKQAVMK